MTQTPTTLATMQQLRSSTVGEFPLNLEPGQIAFNISTGNTIADEDFYNIYMFVGNGSNTRVTESGTVVTTEGESLKGWIRYPLAGRYTQGGTIYGDLTVQDSVLKVTATNPETAELVIPTLDVSPASSSNPGSIRWNTNNNQLQAWNGSKWDLTTHVTVSTTAPPNPSNGDLWLDNTDPTFPSLLVYVVPSSGPAEWKSTFGPAAGTALQPGNGVSANSENQIELINPGDY